MDFVPYEDRKTGEGCEEVLEELESAPEPVREEKTLEEELQKES